MRNEVDEYFYDAAYSTSHKYSLEVNGYECQYRDLFEKAKSHLNKEELILELGCGTGQFADILLKEGYNYSKGIDFSEIAIDMCIKRSGVNKFKCMSLYDYKFTDEYDTIISLEVFEHIKGDLSIIEKIKPNTKVVFSLPRFDNFAHVRYFKTEEVIKERYSAYFSKLDIILLGKIFIINAVKK